MLSMKSQPVKQLPAQTNTHNVTQLRPNKKFTLGTLPLVPNFNPCTLSLKWSYVCWEWDKTIHQSHYQHSSHTHTHTYTSTCIANNGQQCAQVQQCMFTNTYILHLHMCTRTLTHNFMQCSKHHTTYCSVSNHIPYIVHVGNRVCITLTKHLWDLVQGSLDLWVTV